MVLLILAAVSISMLAGEDGIVRNAQKAKDENEDKSYMEMIQLAVNAAMIDENGYGDLTKENISAELRELTDKSFQVEESGDNFTVTFGTNKFQVSKNGEVTGPTKVTPGGSENQASVLYEDYAGDEAEATEGKLHIGDYINYNPIAQGDSGNEAKYQYQSLNENTGIAEAIAANNVTFTDSSQDFTASSSLRWQVIWKEGNNVLITTDTPVVPTNAITMTGATGYGLYGAKSYVNMSPNSGERNEINNISQIYKYGKGADSSKTRGITIEDVNKVTGVTADGTTLTPSGIYVAPTGYKYGTTLTDYKKGTSAGWTPESWLEATTTERQNVANAPGYSGKITGYYYPGSYPSLKTANSTIRNKLIFGESSEKVYWLASRGVYVDSNHSSFGPGLVWHGGTDSGCYGFFDSNGGGCGRACGVRPVVYLNSNVTLTSVGTENNVTTWNID